MAVETHSPFRGGDSALTQELISASAVSKEPHQSLWVQPDANSGKHMNCRDGAETQPAPGVKTASPWA